jgi:hypothetical protein
MAHQRSSLLQQTLLLGERINNGRRVWRDGPTMVANDCGKAKSTMMYWKIRSVTPINHYYLHGRNPKRRCIPSEQEQAVADFVRRELQRNPRHTCRSIGRIILQTFHFNLSVASVHRFLVRNGMSYKNTAIVQALKYTDENIQHYIAYINWIPFIDRRRVFFTDECHFAPRNLQFNKGWSPVGVRQIVLNHHHLGHRGISMSAIISVDEDRRPLYWTTRRGSNSQEDFLLFIIGSIEAGYLPPNSVMVLDNAPVHTGAFAQQALEFITQTQNITFVWLPKYSPELNPIEKVFSVMKRIIRATDLEMEVENAIEFAAERIDHELVNNEYTHCIELHFAQRFIANIQ